MVDIRRRKRAKENPRTISAMHTMHLASAPRRVPLSLQVVNFFNGFSQIGWALFGFGMIFFWVFVSSADFSFLTFRGPHQTVEGHVTGVENTNASENEQPVQAHHYEYSVAGRLHSGTSYVTGDSLAPGATVTVEYDESDPARSRIEGMRRALFGPGVMFVTIFPFVGLALMIPATITGLKRNRLLREGLIANGKLISKRETNVRINRRPVIELCFEFTARDGKRYQAKARTTDTARLEDEAQEPLLYDPNNPTRAYVLDETPARPEFEPNGDLRGRTGAAIAVLILPALVIAVHGWVLLMKLT
jgi:hypothetical protein